MERFAINLYVCYVFFALQGNKVMLLLYYIHWWDRNMWINFISSAFELLGVNGSVINTDPTDPNIVVVQRVSIYYD